MVTSHVVGFILVTLCSSCVAFIRIHAPQHVGKAIGWRKPASRSLHAPRSHHSRKYNVVLTATAGTDVKDIKAKTASDAKSLDITEGIKSGTWLWRENLQIYYEVAGTEYVGGGASPLLLLPGFGVGTFHFERNLAALAESLKRPIYTMDFIGQGLSWPLGPPIETDNLCYSVDTWRDQITGFLEQVVGEPAYLVGNSLGGYLSVCVAYARPDLCAGLALLNATPFWAFNNPNTPMFWDGTLPAPPRLYKIGATYFDTMRNPATVAAMLKAVYVDRSAVDEKLVENIIAATARGPTNQAYGVGGHEAFASIIFSPKAKYRFEDMIKQIACPLTLVYGREDPWVSPMWGARIKRERPDATYFEVSPAGHCAHHEAPAAVNLLLAEWILKVEEQKKIKELEKEALVGVEPKTAEVIAQKASALGLTSVTVVDGLQRRSFIEWADHAVWKVLRQ